MITVNMHLCLHDYSLAESIRVLRLTYKINSNPNSAGLQLTLICTYTGEHVRVWWTVPTAGHRNAVFGNSATKQNEHTSTRLVTEVVEGVYGCTVTNHNGLSSDSASITLQGTYNSDHWQSERLLLDCRA